MIVVREVGIARSVVDGRHAERAEPGDVRPAELGQRGAPDGGQEVLGDRTVQARPRAEVFVYKASLKLVGGAV